MTLRRKFSLLVFGCAVMTAFIVCAISYTQLKSSINQSIQNEISAVGNGQVEKIVEWKASKEAAVSALATYLSHSEPTLETLQQATNAGRFALGYFGSATGVMLQNDPSAILPSDYDPRKRPWYKDAQKTQAVIFTSPYVGASSGKLMITAAQTVQKNGQRIGVAGADINLDDVTRGVLDVELAGEGRAYLANKDGVVLADIDKGHYNKTVKEVFGYQLSDLKDSEIVTINGELVAKFDVPNSNWTIVFELDRGAVMAPLNKLLFTLVPAAIVIALLVSLVMSVISSKLLAGISQVSRALEEISQGEGDLTKRIEIDSKDEVGQLAAHFNRFLGTLGGLISDIKTMSRSLNSLAHDSKTLSLQSSRELGVQLNEITMVATAVSQLSTATQEIALNAENTAGASREAADTSNEGSRIVSGSQQEIKNLATEVHQASEIISNLDVHVQGISSILLTIQDIAEKTNLLALNAAIEAARAGEQGRGFAVVADEVRLLSQRTQSSTEEIREKIEGLNSVTSNVVSSMKRSTAIADGAVDGAAAAATALGSILASVQRISDMAMQIASAAEEQNIVTRDISQNSESIQDISHRLSAEANKTAEGAESLAQVADRLEQQIARFKV
ncbi:methyl-accepting chemotaxis protein [Marinomonas communis]|jgi:methyl-accepting chemotaxis protein|uniref:Methyl-accepting chemotaxis sensory transducer with Cache sensor n=1 Tax=Marinomonas communis TaxID=28254 RepID=A0A4V3DGQ0_9GAMM|nr:methyl-accepting chemotaxis protein [Marinomonas communis]TDR15211.1 methyl-accepting chemotaxis sensory transducer with Cache sensor [Marinomonas communis]